RHNRSARPPLVRCDDGPRSLDLQTRGSLGGPPVASVGQFVRVRSNDLGIGKVVHVGSVDIGVEYFDSVAANGRHRISVLATDVEPVRVSLQRRCYWLDDEVWRVGRVVWRGEGEYGVRPPDSEIDLRVPEGALFVRWSRPISDPTEVLVAGGHE